MEKINKELKRLRSPNYPNYSLKECIGFLKKLHGKYSFKEMHFDDAMTQLGYAPKGSSANRALSSLLSFGLVDTRGTMASKFIQIAAIGKEIILETEGSISWYKLLQTVALNDSSMQLIWNKWGTNLPPVGTIKKSLQLEMGFTPEGANRFAPVIVETYEFAHLNEVVDSDQSEEHVEKTGDANFVYSNDEKSKVEKKQLSSLRKANFLLQGEGREIIIYVPADLTGDEFGLLLQWIALQKNGLVANPIN